MIAGLPDLKAWWIAYAATAIVFLAADMVWLGVIAKPIYTRGIGHLMGAKPNMVAAAAFYLLFPIGLVVFAVASRSAQTWGATLGMSALFGLLAYATYDLTNLATLKDWPVHITLIDMTWGTAASVVAAAAGRGALAWAMSG